MNWTGGNLHRHIRGRGWTRNRSRQRQAFASARGGRASAGSKPIAGKPVDGNPAAGGCEESPFFSIGAFREAGPREREETAQPPVKRRKVREVREVRGPVVVGDDGDARRRRLLAREDWTGISADGYLRVREKASTGAGMRTGAELETETGTETRTETETRTSRHFGAPRAAPGLHLHHPKPIRRDGGHIVQSLESHAHPEPAPRPRPGETPWPPAEHRPEHAYPRAAASAGTTETEDTDNLLPLSDTLPDVTVRFDILESVESADEEVGDGEGSGCGGGISVGDVSLAALLSSQSESAGGGSPECREIGPGDWGWASASRERVTSREESRDSEEDWLDFIFEDGSEVVKRRAFEVARRDAARAVVPSVSSGPDSRAVECSFPSASSGDSRAVECSSSGGGVSDRATCGTGA